MSDAIFALDGRHATWSLTIDSLHPTPNRTRLGRNLQERPAMPAWTRPWAGMPILSMTMGGGHG